LRIERYQARGKRGFSGCSCGLITIGGGIILAILVVLIAPAFPSIGLRLAGFQPIEKTINQSPPEPIPVINSAQTTSQVVLSAGSYGQQTINQSSAYTMQIGVDDNNRDVAQITMTENGILTICGQYTDLCTTTGDQFRNVAVNLQNNRATISGEAFILSLNTWQALSAIVSITTENKIVIDGVEVNGTLFGIPDGELGQQLRDIQTNANGALRQLTLQSNGETYNLSDITITETQLVATFR
jgi:hypothetical protein